MSNSLIFGDKMQRAGVKPTDRIAVAVSGGPDSMGLCLLAYHWKLQHSSSDGLVGMTVDHGLRPESGGEALRVQQWLQEIGMQCEVLTCSWPEGIPQRGHVQQSARKARYNLLQDACKRNNISILLTAHHADDQAELLVLRLSRSSGIVGLAGMALASELFPSIPSRVRHTLLLVRPLLSFYKSDLCEICRAAGQQWIEDPTNKKMIYARNRIRSALLAISASMRDEIQALISLYRKQRADLDAVRDGLLSKYASVNLDFGYVVIDVEGLLTAATDETVLTRFLVAVLQFVAQRGQPPRGRIIQALLDWLQNRPIQTARSGGRCCLSPLPGSRGSKVVATFSPDVHKRPSSQKNGNELLPSLQSAKRSSTVFDKHLLEAKAKAVILDETAEFLAALSREMSEDMFVRNVEESEMGAAIEQQDEGPVLLPGQSVYFMDRFLVSWYQDGSEEVQGCSSNCLCEGSTRLKLRHLNEKDLAELRKLDSGFAEARKQLNSLPKHVKRALVAVTTPDDRLLAVPTLGLRLCPRLETSAEFSPRVPLGGGQSSYE